MQDRLKVLRNECVVKTKLAKYKQRVVLNQHCSDWEFKAGDQVLQKIPGLCGALQDSWEGPYVVSEVISKVNYRIKREGVNGPGGVVHINNIEEVRKRRP